MTYTTKKKKIKKNSLFLNYLIWKKAICLDPYNISCTKISEVTLIQIYSYIFTLFENHIDTDKIM